MTTLTLAFLTAGCVAGDPKDTSGSDADTDTDTDTDTDSDTDTDTDADTDSDTDADQVDTAYMVAAGSFSKSGNALTAFDVGYGWYLGGDFPGTELCHYAGTGTVAGPLDGCAECDWAFEISASMEAPTGSDCDMLADGEATADTFIAQTTGIGWSDAYTFAYYGYYFEYTNVVWEYYYFSGYGSYWLRVAGIYSGDYGTFGYVTGDTNGAEFIGTRPYAYYPIYE